MKHNHQNTVSFCTQPWSNLFLRCTGRVQPCCMNSTHLGKITNNSLDDVWNGKEIQRVRQLIINKKYKEAGCKSGCPALYILNTEQTVSTSPHQWHEAAKLNLNFKANLHSYEDAISQKKTIISNTPITLDIQPTEACNMQCIMCHQQHSRQDTIAPEFINKLLQHHYSLYAIRFQGGEIFLDSQFSLFLLELKNKLLPYQSIKVITNGTLLSCQQLDQLTDAPPIEFVVSVDAVDEKTYKSIRKAPLFNKAMATIEHLSKQQIQRKISNLVDWNFVVMRSNFHQIKEAIEWAHRLRVKISFQPIIGQYPKENIFDFPELREENAQSYIQTCINTAHSLQANACNLKIILEKLN